MIWPNKHTDVRATVLSVAAFLLKTIKDRRSEGFGDLQVALESDNPKSASLFVKALSLLFMLGLVVYHRKSDSIEYTGPS